ncbi:3-hydroxyisobutyrate dehydrogenase [Lampropedia aestuarii]|uniref:3-hydroxyisobutyrate dehydrogenase n=1 Tax=Lampropedia aestuarii TaxID=2562762 RepID=A0A4S5BFM7_9BURK|nr:3-hydroxyisobutyrate dehydrogenase [Lampropedia aestuarii]MDH5856099.1 3-hydroxyisobutyrate dehydrogenase [Lampropedia aestuarii]THJ31134.1 3-hydroxyisobutyrate dehydrogenase [Lampropedia aestuarii]
MKIAFIGLGNMGSGMALNLHKAGHEVTGFDLSDAAKSQLAAQGLQVAASAVDAVQGAQAVITMLPASEHVEQLFIGTAEQAGLLAILPAGCLVIDSSTIAADTSRSVGAAAAARGIDFLDAPVSGGTAGAAAGTLTFMVGASDSTLARAKPLLEAMGKNIFHAGEIGAGQTAKICNNMLLAVQMAGTCEALALGIANGLDPKVLSEIMRRSSGGNWTLEVYNPVPGVQENSAASRGYTGGFGTDLMLKDLGLALNNAVKNKAATPLGTLARSLYAAHSLQGRGAEDFSSIIKMLQKPV